MNRSAGRVPLLIAEFNVIPTTALFVVFLFICVFSFIVTEAPTARAIPAHTSTGGSRISARVIIHSITEISDPLHRHRRVAAPLPMIIGCLGSSSQSFFR
jgi:hypothetical protein